METYATSLLPVVDVFTNSTITTRSFLNSWGLPLTLNRQELGVLEVKALGW